MKKKKKKKPGSSNRTENSPNNFCTVTALSFAVRWVLPYLRANDSSSWVATSIFMSFPPGGSFSKSSKKILVALIASCEKEEKKKGEMDIQKICRWKTIYSLSWIY